MGIFSIYTLKILYQVATLCYKRRNIVDTLYVLFYAKKLFDIIRFRYRYKSVTQAYTKNISMNYTVPYMDTYSHTTIMPHTTILPHTNVLSYTKIQQKKDSQKEPQKDTLEKTLCGDFVLM